MIDIDHFKKFNDHYGHQSGYNALYLVGQAIKKALKRATDIPIRYGGEEFAVILPSMGENGARHVASNILRMVRDLKISHEFNSAAPIVTVSIGIAAVNRDILNPDELFKEADDMLYKAKKNGRNRVYPINEISTGDSTRRTSVLGNLIPYLPVTIQSLPKN